MPNHLSDKEVRDSCRAEAACVRVTQVVEPEIFNSRILERSCPSLANVFAGWLGFRKLGKANGESTPNNFRQRNSSALHLAESGMFRIPARVFDSRTLNNVVREVNSVPPQ